MKGAMWYQDGIKIALRPQPTSRPGATMRQALTCAALVLVVLLHSASGAPAATPAEADTGYADAFASPARFWALRLRPGQDLRVELGRFARAKRLRAGFVASCAGSCTRTSVRHANQPGASVREGHFEIVSLTGTLAMDGMHVHAGFADSTGATFGGHLMDGSLVYTTAEIVIGELDRATFAREVDSTYGYRELSVRRR
jgi:predicted DNA-binding protein with PD1-like motif